MAITERIDWRDAAACRGRDDLFYPSAEETIRTPWIYDEPRSICAACPVLADCREFVLAHPQHGGLWAGMTEDERRDARRRRAQGITWQPSLLAPPVSTPVALR